MESSNDDLSEDEIVVSQKRKPDDSVDRDESKKRSKGADNVKKFLDEEAELSGDDDGDDDEEDGDGPAEDVNEYVPDGFVILDENDDSNKEKDKSKKKTFNRLRKNKGEMQIVEDDIALIQENYAERHKEMPNKKVKSNEIAPERVYAENGESNDQIVNASAGEESGNDEDDDDMDSFLDDDVDGVANDNDEGKARHERRKMSYIRNQDGPAEEEINEAFDIFGEGIEEFYGEEDDGAESGADSVDREDDDDEDDLFSDKEERREKRRAAAIKKQKK